jgi:hypothetical protein
MSIHAPSLHAASAAAQRGSVSAHAPARTGNWPDPMRSRSSVGNWPDPMRPWCPASGS